MSIKRKNGLTIIDLEGLGMRIKTNLINRHRFNDLTKKDKILPTDIMLALRKRLGGK